MNPFKLFMPWTWGKGKDYWQFERTHLMYVDINTWQPGVNEDDVYQLFGRYFRGRELEERFKEFSTSRRVLLFLPDVDTGDLFLQDLGEANVIAECSRREALRDIHCWTGRNYEAFQDLQVCETCEVLSPEIDWDDNTCGKCGDTTTRVEEMKPKEVKRYVSKLAKEAA